MNFSNMISSGMKIIKLTNKAIPVIKEINPTLNKLKNKKLLKNPVVAPTGKMHPNNNLTFFK